MANLSVLSPGNIYIYIYDFVCLSKFHNPAATFRKCTFVDSTAPKIEYQWELWESLQRNNYFVILGHQTSLPPLHSYCKNQSNWKLPSSRLHQMVVLLSLTVFFNMESNFESSWYRLGTGLLPAWYQLGTDMVQAWYYLVPVWSPAWSPAWFHHRRASGVVWNQMDLGPILKPPTLRIEIWEQAHQDAARTPPGRREPALTPSVG